MSDLYLDFRAALRIDPSLPDDAVTAQRWPCPVCDSSDGLALKRGDSVDAVAKCHACSADYAALAEALDIQSGEGCDVESLADHLGMPESWLRDQGWADNRYGGVTRVAIPYPPDPVTGNDSVRYRLSLDTKRKFAWKRGTKAGRVLYNGDGLDGTESEVFLVEGESDAVVLLYGAEVAAVGLPGATMWKDEYHAQALAHVETIYAVVEPDAGGASLRESLAKSVLRDKVKLVDLRFSDGENELHFKDVRDLYNWSSKNFVPFLKAACEAAVSFAERDEQNRQFEASFALAEARGLELEPDLIECFLAQARRRYVGEESALVAVFLATFSSLQRRPINVLVDGVSSVGKSALVEEVFDFFPASYVYFRSSVTPATLAYTDESFVQRVIAFAEAQGAIKSDDLVYTLRTLLSERRLVHEVTVKNPDTGEFTTKYIEKPGPTGLIMSTTATWLDEELETRMTRVSTDDSPEQTKRVLLAEARVDYGEEIDDSDEMKRWHAFMDWQRASGLPARAHIPFAEALAQEIPPIATRLRRDFRTLCAFIEAHALLHRATRDVDERGRTIATLDDYAAVREHLGKFFSEGVNASIPDKTRETVQAVGRVLERKNVLLVGMIDEHVSYAELGKELKIDKSSARRRALEALNDGFLKNSAGRGKPAELVLGLPLPDLDEDTELFPTVEQLERITACPTQA